MGFPSRLGLGIGLGLGDEVPLLLFPLFPLFLLLLLLLLLLLQEAVASGDEVPLGTPPVDRLLGTYHHSRSSRTFRIALLTIVALLTLALLGLNESPCVHSACTRHLLSGMPPAFCARCATTARLQRDNTATMTLS